MKTPRTSLLCATTFALCLLATTSFPAPSLHAQSLEQKSSSVNAAGIAILNRDQAGAILPSSVFYAGQSATTQLRNSAGLRTKDGLVLATLVDTSGYSSAVQQTYQAYLITERPLVIDTQTLPPGAYGFGFIANNRIVVMDIGGHQLLAATTTRDESLPRPNPLQILADPSSPTHFRLYLGRSFVTLIIP
jgi:hypothetical protein